MIKGARVNGCNLCGSNFSNSIHNLPGHQLNARYLDHPCCTADHLYGTILNHCSNCSHLQAISPMSLESLYNERNNYINKKPDVHNDHTFLAKRILAFCACKKFDMVMDIGCFDINLSGTLKDSDLAAKHWIKIDSVPMWEKITPEGVHFVNGYVPAVTTPDSDAKQPDLVLPDQVFEHIPDQRQVLSNF
jgi:hypothetical protein